MRVQFEEQLALLHQELSAMGELCEQAAACAAQSLFQRESVLVEKVFEIEEEIDEKEREIEGMCMKLLLKQQPVAGDFKRISAALKMISDMERIGDQALDIAELVRHRKTPEKRVCHKMKKMAETVIQMVTDSVDSFVYRDLQTAGEVIGADDAVDALFDEIRAELIAEIAAKPEQGSDWMDLFMAAKYLERIGDHATNIAEWAEFSITGVHNRGDL